MRKTRVYLYSFFLGVGAALVGVVIGFLVKSPPPAVSSLLLAVGLLLLLAAWGLGRRIWRV
ncbi:MAG: hypothetical protein ACP5G2_00520 [Candidatus Bipolaricaulaceae bacterium]